jgi:hypothetical protein
MTTNFFFFSTISFYIQYQPCNIYNSANRDRAGGQNVSIFALAKRATTIFSCFFGWVFYALGGTAGKPPTQIRQE